MITWQFTIRTVLENLRATHIKSGGFFEYDQAKQIIKPLKEYICQCEVCDKALANLILALENKEKWGKLSIQYKKCIECLNSSMENEEYQ